MSSPRLRATKAELKQEAFGAFRDPQALAAFALKVPAVPRLDRWLRYNLPRIVRQLSQPVGPLSTGALEQILQETKRRMSYRRALFRNKERTDALLGLYVNDYNGLTDRRVYEMLVEEQIAPRRGRGDPPHACLDGMHFYMHF